MFTVGLEGCFSIRLTFESVDWVKQMALLLWEGLIQSVEDLNRAKRVGKKDSPAWLWAGTLAFPAFRLSLKQQLGSQTCWLLDWDSNNEPSRFLGLWTQSGATYTLVLLGLQLTVCRLWDTSGSLIVKSFPYHISFLCIHVCIHLIYEIVCVC